MRVICDLGANKGNYDRATVVLRNTRAGMRFDQGNVRAVNFSAHRNVLTEVGRTNNSIHGRSRLLFRLT